MRRHLVIVAVACLYPAIARPDEATELRDRALKACAKDPADLKKLRVHTLKAKGISHAGTDPSPAEHEMSAVWPGQIRLRWDFGVGASKTTVTVGGSDDRGWRKVGDTKAVDLSIEELNDFRADTYAIWVATLSTLNDVDNKLTVASPSKVNGEVVLGLKITRRSWPDVTLYFDSKSALLRKMAYKAREAGVTANKEFIYDGHKDFKGLMLPTKQSLMIGNREVFVWNEIEYDFPEKIEPKLFEKP